MKNESKDLIDQALGRLTDYTAGDVPSWSSFESRRMRVHDGRRRIVRWGLGVVAAAAVLSGLTLIVINPWQELRHESELIPAANVAAVAPNEALLSEPDKEPPVRLNYTARTTYLADAVSHSQGEPVVRKADEELLAVITGEPTVEPTIDPTIDPKSDVVTKTEPLTEKKSKPIVYQTPDYQRSNQYTRPRVARKLKVTTGLFANISSGSNDVARKTPMGNPVMMDYRVGQYTGEMNFYPADFVHHFPVSVGASVQFELLPRFNIQTGLVYTYLRSTSEKKPDMTYKYIQNLHYLGVPLNLSYDFITNRRIDFYATAGAMIEFAVDGSVRTQVLSNAGQVSSSSEKIDTRGVMLSFNAAAGLNVHLTPHVGLYVEPGVSTYLSNGTHPINFRTQSAVQFNMRVGIRVKL